jgi:hypothetical protein
MFYEGEPANRSQMDMKSKLCDIRNWKNNIFLDVSSTNLSHLFISTSKPVAQKSFLFYCCLSHFRTSVLTSSSSAKRLPTSWNSFTRQTLPTVNRKHFFMNILCIESFCPQKRTTERCSSLVHPQARSPFWLLKPASEHAHARLLLFLFRKKFMYIQKWPRQCPSGLT